MNWDKGGGKKKIGKRPSPLTPRGKRKGGGRRHAHPANNATRCTARRVDDIEGATQQQGRKEREEEKEVRIVLARKSVQRNSLEAQGRRPASLYEIRGGRGEKRTVKGG